MNSLLKLVVLFVALFGGVNSLPQTTVATLQQWLSQQSNITPDQAASIAMQIQQIQTPLATSQIQNLQHW